MQTIKLFVIPFLAAMLLTSCYKETDLLVNTAFQASIKNNNYTAPVSVSLENNTTGADFYEWTFAGATPAFSKEQNPETVVYAKAGTYTIKLEAWNSTHRNVKEFTFSVDSAVAISFDAEILVNDYAPARVKLTNRTTGASSFAWTFEGGTPASSTSRNPDNVEFDAAGEHKISLTVTNGRESFSLSKTVVLEPKINVDFVIQPSFDDFDYEVPFIASLVNQTTGGLTYEWTSTGGSIASKNEKNTSISFTTAGTYSISLTGDNQKEAKTQTKTITLKSNSNLYTLNNVKFGIKKAESSIGCSYSLSQRTILTKEEINSATGKEVNLLFFGLDAGFSRCYFLSPTDAVTSGFTSIPGATHTYFVNDLSVSGLSFTDNDFTTMTTDARLRTLDIRQAASTSSWFTNVYLPRLVLFETASGIKGAIRIKAFVSEGDASYVLADIKVQKEKAQ